MKKILLTLSLSLILIQPVPATLLTFDDFTIEDLIRSAGQVPSGYGGLGWLDFYAGVSDGNNAASAFGIPYSAMTSGLHPFTLNGAYLSYNGGWPLANRSVEVYGVYRGAILYDNTYLLGDQPSWFAFNYFGVDTVYFKVPQGDAGSYISFRMDDMIINESAVAIPEPATYLAGALLLLPLATGALWRLRRA